MIHFENISMKHQYNENINNQKSIKSLFNSTQSLEMMLGDLTREKKHTTLSYTDNKTRRWCHLGSVYENYYDFQKLSSIFPVFHRSGLEAKRKSILQRRSTFLGNVIKCATVTVLEKHTRCHNF